MRAFRAGFTWLLFSFPAFAEATGAARGALPDPSTPAGSAPATASPAPPSGEPPSTGTAPAEGASAAASPSSSAAPAAPPSTPPAGSTATALAYGPPPTYYAPPPTYYGYGYPPPPPTEDRHAYRHDGFYLRMGLGIGYGRATSSGTIDVDSVDATYTGLGPAYELLIGGTVGRGFVIGGGFAGQDISNPDLSLQSSTDPTLSSRLTLNGALGIGVLGPFLDWYPDDTGGFHVGIMAGFGIIGLKDDKSVGGSVWTGYDFWVGKEWSLGAELRAAAASGSRDIPDGNAHLDDGAATYELVFDALYH